MSFWEAAFEACVVYFDLFGAECVGVVAGAVCVGVVFLHCSTIPNDNCY